MKKRIFNSTEVITVDGCLTIKQDGNEVYLHSNEVEVLTEKLALDMGLSKLVEGWISNVTSSPDWWLNIDSRDADTIRDLESAISKVNPN